MSDDTVTIDRRFRGPLDSANGGYAAGLLGSRLPGVAQVTLRLPPPLERPLAVRRKNFSQARLDRARARRPHGTERPRRNA